MVLRIFPIVAVLGLVCVGGCGVGSRQGGVVTFESKTQGKSLAQNFNHAYITQAKAGEFDVVLVDNAADWDYRKPKGKQPIRPVELAPIRQVMHIHLYWRPVMGTTKNPAAVNASINWYVLGPEGSSDVLVYEGAGYVSLRGGDSKRQVIIRDAQIATKDNRGDLRDPIGAANISGTVVAATNDVRVKDTLADVLKLVEGASAGGK